MIAPVLATLCVGMLIFAVGVGVGGDYRRKNEPTVQEKLDAVMKSANPASGDDLLRLMAARVVFFDKQTHKWQLRLWVGDMYIRSPEREECALLVKDIAKFEASVLAAKQVEQV